MKAKIDALKPTKARTVASVVESLEAHLDDRQVSDPVRCRAVNQLFSKYCQIEEKVLKDQGEVPLPNKQRKWRLKQKLAVGPEGQVSDFYEYLSACTTKELKDFLPTTVVEKLKTDGAQELADALYLHWSLLNCSRLKLALRLSKNQWGMLRNVLFRKYRHDLGTYEEIFLVPPSGSEFLASIRWKLPPSFYKLNQWADAVCADFGLEESLDGFVACVDLTEQLRRDLKADIANGFFVKEGPGELVSAITKGKPILQFMFDAAGTVRQRKTTILAFKIVNGSRDTHKPRFTHTTACSEGGDDWETLVVNLEEPLETVNCYIENEELMLDEEKIPCIVYGGADQAGVHSNFGMGSCKDEHSCPLCEAKNFCQSEERLEQEPLQCSIR
jgi:hypothetical protein